MPHNPQHSEEIQKLLERGNVLGKQAAQQSGKPFTPSVLAKPPISPPVTTPSTATTPSVAVVNTITGDLIKPSPSQMTFTDPTPVQIPSIQGGAVPTTEPTPKPAEVGTDFTKELETSFSRLLGKGAEEAKRISERVTPLETQLGEINKQIKILQAQDLEIEKEAERRNVLQPFAAGEAAKAKRENAIEVLKLSAKAEGIRGDITLAERQIKRAVDLEFAETERDIRIKKQNLIANYDSFTPAEKKRADALLLELDRQDTFVAEQKKNREEVEKIAIRAAEGGADNVTLEKISQAGTSLEATTIASPFLKKAPDVTATAGSVEEFKLIHGRAPTSLEELNKFTATRAAAGRAVTEDKLLSVSEAKALGVPFGTTEKQAAALRKVPVSEAKELKTFQSTETIGGRRVRIVFDEKGKEISRIDLGEAGEATTAEQKRLFLQYLATIEPNTKSKNELEREALQAGLSPADKDIDEGIKNINKKGFFSKVRGFFTGE